MVQQGSKPACHSDSGHIESRTEYPTFPRAQERVSERASERESAVERTSEEGSAEQANKLAVQANEREDERAAHY